MKIESKSNNEASVRTFTRTKTLVDESTVNKIDGLIYDFRNERRDHLTCPDINL